jgi:hypothetical protein
MESTHQKTLKFLSATLAVSIVLAVILLLSPALYAAQIKIAVWYIRQLRDTNNERSALRKQRDYDRLAKYATRLDADIVALSGCWSDPMNSTKGDCVRLSIQSG